MLSPQTSWVFLANAVERAVSKDQSLGVSLRFKTVVSQGFLDASCEHAEPLAFGVGSTTKCLRHRLPGLDRGFYCGSQQAACQFILPGRK